jgi:hypothetical protein
VHHEQEADIKDAEKPPAVEMSALRSVLGEAAASVQKAARDIDQVGAVETE